MKHQTIQIFGEVGISTIDEGVDLSTITFEFIHSGKVYTNRYGEVQFTPEQLQEMADNFNAGVAGMEIAVDINHDPEKRAYAWIKPDSLYIAQSINEQGQYSLFGKLYRFTPEGDHLVRTGAFRYFSIEVHYNVKRYIEGKLKTFKNVLMGLALTNFPAIKGLAPTFSDNLLTNKTANMETFKIFLSALAAKATVSKKEKETLTSMVLTLSDEEKEEIASEVADVEAKPEEEEKKEEEKEETTLSELPTLVAKLTESNKALHEKVSQMEAKNKELKLSESKNAIMLSATNTTGFTKDSESEVEAFMSTLSDEQLVQFKSLVSKVKTVQLGETGSTTKADDSDIDTKAIALSEEIMSKDPSIVQWKALSQAYEELGA